MLLQVYIWDKVNSAGSWNLIFSFLQNYLSGVQNNCFCSNCGEIII